MVAVVTISQGSIRRLTPALTASVTGGESDFAPSGATPDRRVEIGLEHTKPVTLSLAFTTQFNKGVADFSHDALETIAVSVPSAWMRREVKGVPLLAVTSDQSTFGFTRWHIPPGALVSFDITPPSAILLHNPSGVPAEIRLTRVNLTTQKAERDVVLVKDGTVELW